METNAGLIIKLLVFVLDLFIIVFNFVAFRSYLPLKDRQRHVEVRNKAQQTYVAGDIDPKLLLDRKQNYQYKNSSNSNLINKNMQQPNCAYSSNGRPNSNQLLGGGHCPKYFPDCREREYRRDDNKYNRSVCHCEHCKEVKRPLSKL